MQISDGVGQLGGFNLPILVAPGMAILGGWVFGAEALRRYVNEVSDWQVGRWWHVSIKWVVPIVLAILLASHASSIYTTYRHPRALNCGKSA